MMLPLDALFVMLAVAGLLAAALAVWATRRLEPAPVAAVGTLTLGVAALAEHVPGPGLLTLDLVSLPLVPLTGLALGVILGVLPARQRDPDRIAALLALSAAHVALAVAPLGLPVAGIWVLEGVATAWVLPGGPARRLAAPYLAFGVLCGVAGLVLGGDAGAVLLILAVAARLGVAPFHTWLVGAWTLAPTTLAVALASPMAALSLVVRVPFGETPWVGGPVTLLLTGSALLAAGLALTQRTLERAIGLLTASVAAGVLIGVLDADPTGHLGGLMMWGLTGLALVGLGGVTAALRSRLGPVPLDAHGGLAQGTPILGLLFLVFGLGAIGAPGTADFISGELVLHGGLAHHPASLMGFAAAMSVQGYVVMHLFMRVFFGPARSQPVPDALRRERLVLVGLAAALLLGGLAPQVWIDGLLSAGPMVAVLP